MWFGDLCLHIEPCSSCSFTSMKLSSTCSDLVARPEVLLFVSAADAWLPFVSFSRCIWEAAPLPTYASCWCSSYDSPRAPAGANQQATLVAWLPLLRAWGRSPELLVAAWFGVTRKAASTLTTQEAAGQNGKWSGKSFSPGQDLFLCLLINNEEDRPSPEAQVEADLTSPLWLQVPCVERSCRWWSLWSQKTGSKGLKQQRPPCQSVLGTSQVSELLAERLWVVVF